MKTPDNSNTSISMGLDAIFSVADETIDINLKEEIRKEGSINQIATQLINSSKFQARKNFPDAYITELANSIKENGILQPLLVRPLLEKDQFELIAGECRLRAATKIGLESVPVIVCEVNDVTAMAFGLIENIQRQALNPIEEAEALGRLIDELELSHQELSDRIGKSRSYITNMLRVNALDTSVKSYVISGEINIGHARALLTLPLEQQITLARKIVEKNLTVRDAERLAQLSKQPKVKEVAHFTNEVDTWTRQLSRSLSSKVTVNINDRGEGKVVIHFSSPSEVDWLVDHFEDKIDG